LAIARASEVSQRQALGDDRIDLRDEIGWECPAGVVDGVHRVQ
jgi:hypothetical protein